MGVALAWIIFPVFLGIIAAAAVELSDEHHKLLDLDKCSSSGNCLTGHFCSSCRVEFQGSRCVRSSTTNPFKLLNTSLPYNKYAYLTTHNSFAIKKRSIPDATPLVTFTNQEDTISQQLYNGVRALMLDTYDYKGDIWLCHSFKGKCHDFTAFEPAINALKEVENFLSANPSEIVTLILEDHVEAPNGLTNVFKASGLMKYWFPVSNMPKDGKDWPLVKDMIVKNHRLIGFGSQKNKEQSEGIAYQWNYMVENQYGKDGMVQGKCPKREDSSELNDRSKSLVLVNHFRTIPIQQATCKDNSKDLINMLSTCYAVAGNRWANFVAVDYYKRSDGGGPFQAVDMLNGKLMCGCDDVHACAHGSSCTRGSR
ncbi:hypothetical protein P8452_43035 [Trifolium repens]|nr:hypothetical protein P8452_43035 [Trifolium repens]